LGLSVLQAKRVRKASEANKAELSDEDVAEMLGLVEPTSTDTFLQAALAKRLSEDKDKDGFGACLVALRKLRDAVGA